MICFQDFFLFVVLIRNRVFLSRWFHSQSYENNISYVSDWLKACRSIPNAYFSIYFLLPFSMEGYSGQKCNLIETCIPLDRTFVQLDRTFIPLIKSNQILVFGERGKPEYPEKNLSEQSREPANSTYIWRRVRKSNPGHVGGRRALSPLRQPCSPQSGCSPQIGCSPHWIVLQLFCCKLCSIGLFLCDIPRLTVRARKPHSIGS